MMVKDITLDTFPDIVPATLTAYVPDVYPEIDPQRQRPAIVLCPGGAYCFRSRTEAEPVALRFAAGGCNVFLLEYAVAPHCFPTAMRQLAAAVATVRRHAKELHTDPDRILLCGFSAGGHLCASLGVYWPKDEWFPDGPSREERRPNGLILCYPLTGFRAPTHLRSRRALLGEEAGATLDAIDQDDGASIPPPQRARAEALLDAVCLDEHISADTPSAFLWHSCEDPSVPVQNSLRFANALIDHGVNAELHIFPHGPHGTSLGTDQALGDPDKICRAADSRVWMDLALRWIHQSLA